MDDKKFLESYDVSKFKRPSVTVDIVVFTIIAHKLNVLLIRRGEPPFKDLYAIPGGFVNYEEDLETAAKRELFEETNVKGIYLEQFHTFGKPNRDPRTRVITVAHIALVSSEGIKLLSRADAKDAQWIDVDELPKNMAFDHSEILRMGLAYLRERIGESNIAFQFLPEKFTLTDLQKVHEEVLGTQIDKRNFRKRILALNLVKKVSGKRTGVHRPAQLYSFTK
jgi:8-oxo-dGTP diphosphatase